MKMNELHYSELAEILFNWFGDDDIDSISDYLAINLLQLSKGEQTFDEFLTKIQD